MGRVGAVVVCMDVVSCGLGGLPLLDSSFPKTSQEVREAHPVYVGDATP